MWLQVEKGVYKSDFQERLVLEILKGDTSSRKINKNEVNKAVCYYIQVNKSLIKTSSLYFMKDIEI